MVDRETRRGARLFGYVQDVALGEFAGIDMESLVATVGRVEAAHRPQVSTTDLRPTHCSCRAQFSSDDPFREAHAHLLEALVQATVRALTGPCDTCNGTGTWRKFAGMLTCPDCNGLGQSVLPLKPMEFRDDHGEVWLVTKLVDEERAFVERRDLT